MIKLFYLHKVIMLNCKLDPIGHSRVVSTYNLISST
jgi:hypothetical protein